MTGKVLLPEGKLYPLKPHYAESVQRCGGQPKVIRYSDPKPDVDDFDALLLCGGVDIDPKYFGQTPLEGANLEIDPDRDELELMLLEAFIERRKPVYGICRGIQVINVAFKGTLWQDLHAQCGLVHSHQDKDETMWHDVHMADGRVLSVNSFHHQAIKELGDGLFSLGNTADGIIEAIRHKSLPIGAVQWHPERMGDGAFAFLSKLVT